MPKVYWIGSDNRIDDFGQIITDTFIDGKTKMGPWAIMTPDSYDTYGIGRYGQGYGQRYVKQADGRFMKVEG